MSGNESLSGSKALVTGLLAQSREKRAFDWTRLLPWIPGVTDIRRRGTAADVTSPEHMSALRSKLDRINRRKDLQRALGKSRAGVARTGTVGSRWY